MRKWEFMDMQAATYTSFVDAVLITVFGFMPQGEEDGRLCAGPVVEHQQKLLPVRAVPHMCLRACACARVCGPPLPPK